MSRKSQRDESLDQLLKESFRASSRGQAAGSCPDAETLAAWTEGALEGRQLAAAQEHVADCVECQATLATLVRMTPPEVSPEPWWRRGLRARWLVPVAATATAIAIWVAVPREEFTRPPEQVLTAAREAAAPQTEAAAEPPAAVTESAPAGTRSAESRPLEQPTADLRLEAAQKAAPADAIEERRNAEPPALERSAAESRLDAAVKPAPETAGARPEEAPAPLGRAAAAAPQPAAPAPARAGSFGAFRQGVTTIPRQIVVASPGTAFRWRIGPAGAVEYSADAGRTWEARPTGVDVDLLAGTSPSGTVCWVVGRSGTALLTTDGRQWRRLAFPVAVDLSAVQATDARTATVTSVDGRRFRTVDGGTTWESF